MSKSKVTILITCYNGARFLSAAVDSALSQDYAPIEVVVVDDGSTDDTPEVMAGYGAKILGIRQENIGCAGARNTGLAATDGEIVVILDSDDILLPEAVSSKVALLQSQPNVGLATSVAGYIDENGSPIAGAVDLKPAYPNGVSYVDAMHRIPGPISGWAIPRSILSEIGNFDSSLRAVEDYDICLKILAKHMCLCDPRVRMLYREVSGSLSRDHIHNYDHIRRVIKKHRSLAPISSLAYWYHSRIMLLTSCAGVFTRILKEGGNGKGKRLVNFLSKRPSAIPYFVLWGGRACFNRALSWFHLGPLWKKRVALQNRAAE